MRFQGAKKRPAKFQELNTLVASTVSEVLKKSKSRAKHDSISEEYPEDFNFENLSIRE